MVEFKNLDIEIRGHEAVGYTVVATGPEEEQVAAPFPATLRADLSADLDRVRAGWTDREMWQRLGTALFQALFPPQVLPLYRAARARLKAEAGLRLRLHLPAELACLPWELLYDPPFYLATDPRSPVVRFLRLPEPPDPLAVRPPLRLLHLMANPSDAPRLHLEQEATLLHSALAGLEAEGFVEIVPAQPGTVAALRDGLRRGCHVLHFSGHGGVDLGKGYLVFEDDEGPGRAVDSDTLAHLLRGSQVRLALLNTCESATASDTDAFGSVAAALVRAGLPAVIAHQGPMPDRSAALFAAEFYRALAQGLPVDMAVGEGRKALLSEPEVAWQDNGQWAIPVLFMNVPDGHILTLEEGEARAAGLSPSPIVRQDTRIETISGGVVSIGGIGEINIGPGGLLPGGQKPEPPPSTDPLLDLLDQLRGVVRDYAGVRQAEALEKVVLLEGAILGRRLDLALMEAVLQWFQAELPHLQGAVLSAIGGAEPKAEKAGDKVLREFRQRFGRFS